MALMTLVCKTRSCFRLNAIACQSLCIITTLSELFHIYTACPDSGWSYSRRSWHNHLGISAVYFSGSLWPVWLSLEGMPSIRTLHIS